MFCQNAITVLQMFLIKTLHLPFAELKKLRIFYYIQVFYLHFTLSDYRTTTITQQ